MRSFAIVTRIQIYVSMVFLNYGVNFQPTCQILVFVLLAKREYVLYSHTMRVWSYSSCVLSEQREKTHIGAIT